MTDVLVFAPLAALVFGAALYLGLRGRPGRDDLGDKLDFETAGGSDARHVAAMFSRGNVAIQAGAFLTIEDLERERDFIARHSFPN